LTELSKNEKGLFERSIITPHSGRKRKAKHETNKLGQINRHRMKH